MNTTDTMNVNEIAELIWAHGWEVHPAFVNADIAFPRSQVKALRDRLFNADAAGEDDLVLYPSGAILPGYWAFVGTGVLIARAGVYKEEAITATYLNDLLEPFGWRVSPSGFKVPEEVVTTYNRPSFNRAVVGSLLGLMADGHTIAYVSLATGRVTRDATGAAPVVRIVANPAGNMTISTEFAMSVS